MTYPVFVNLSGLRCVVVGGGRVAGRRVESLLQHGGDVVVVAPEIGATVRQLHEAGGITWIAEQFASRHIEDAYLVVAATDDARVNADVARAARSLNILACRVDDPADGTFITPAIVERGDLTIAIATGGSSPTLTAVLRRRLETEFGPEWAQWAILFARLRPMIKQIEQDTARQEMVELILNDANIRTRVGRADMAGAIEGAMRCMSLLQA